jgi:hypothetical protein
MPTHQGKTQTDIVIGDGGESIELDARIEFTATYSVSQGQVNFQYLMNNSSGANDENSSYELKLLDAVGSPLARWYAQYTAEPVPGTATNVTSTRTNTFNPSANGSAPTFPAAYETYVSRNWSVTATKQNQTFGQFKCFWKFASTCASGYTVTQTVNTQGNSLLDVTLLYEDATGGDVIEVRVECYAVATKSHSSIQLSSPSITDNIQN